MNRVTRITRVPWVTRMTRVVRMTRTGLLIFRGKKSKILQDFQEQICGKINRFRGIFAGKRLKFAEKSADFRDFRGKKVKVRGKIG